MVILNRRRFLQMGSLATAASLVPRFLKALESKRLAEGPKSLVILQLSGGNDGLNTLIPFRDDPYYRLRPKLGIPASRVLALDGTQGLHPALKGLKDLYDQGDLGLLNGVGYPNPDRSHFRSMDIWQTASRSDQVLTTGWIGRYLDAQCCGKANPSQALEMDDTLSRTLKGSTMTGIAVGDPKRLYGASQDPYFRVVLDHPPVEDDHLQVAYLYKTMAETLSSADYIYTHSRIYQSRAPYPDTRIGKDLRTIAELIVSGINTRVYYLSLGSFDTHVNQQPQQERLLAQMGDALQVFASDLRQQGRFGDVLVMTFSEFGRRVAENASGGTDHGTANCMFLLSGGLKRQGVLNPAPSLGDLDQGDLNYQVDFRDVYATLLQQWLGADQEPVLGNDRSLLDFI